MYVCMCVCVCVCVWATGQETAFPRDSFISIIVSKCEGDVVSWC